MVKTHETELAVQARSLELLYALNAVAAALQNSIRSEEYIYAVFQEQIITLKLRGGISLLDDQGSVLHFKTVAFTNPLKKIIGRYETELKTSAKGYSIPVEKVDVYQQVIHEGRSVFVSDTSAISAQVMPKQVKGLVKSLLSILGTPPGIFTPLIYDGKVKGMLNIVGSNLTEGDIPTMQAFANQIAVALENARLVEKMQSTNGQLQQKIAELERFAYTVSHELKNPLVTIKGFVGSIEKDLENRNYERAHKDIQRVSTATDRMNDTILGLLKLSKIGQVVHPPEQVDLAGLAHEALGRINAGDIKIHISSDLPIVYGDRDRLREVFENLIENAARYMGAQSEPLLEIGAHTDGNEKVLFVKDNGLGIDPQYHTKVFGLFEKLDGQSEGAGIGLALVKRIIETHGGRIWVESEGVGKGSTFCFTIPDNRKQNTSQT
jgi:signal transduction histidine kinase